MSDVTVVDLKSIGGGKRSGANYRKYFDAALSMPRGQAVLVDIEGLKNLYESLLGVISRMSLKEKLAVVRRNGLIYIIHREDKVA